MIYQATVARCAFRLLCLLLELPFLCFSLGVKKTPRTCQPAVVAAAVMRFECVSVIHCVWLTLYNLTCDTVRHACPTQQLLLQQRTVLTVTFTKITQSVSPCLRESRASSINRSFFPHGGLATGQSSPPPPPPPEGTPLAAAEKCHGPF